MNVENMQKAGVAEEDARDRVKWRKMVSCGS